MKKRNLKSLSLNKKSISNFEVSIKGGADEPSWNWTSKNDYISYCWQCPTNDVPAGPSF